MIDHFLVLEVHMLASNEIIKAAYKRLCQRYHPDNGGSTEQMLRLQEAYDVLIDPKKRQTYVADWLKERVRECEFEEAQSFNLEELFLLPLKNMVNEYMYFIMNKEYEEAYEMLSVHNKKRLFKRDFILWQKLISEIHELIDFDAIFLKINNEDEIMQELSESEKFVVFKVKVKEVNHILNRIEEDYFLRYLCFEGGEWKVRLKDGNIHATIKKYKRILALHKKRNRRVRELILSTERPFSTQGISLQLMIQNCEYEYLRFVRYGRVFSLVLFEVNVKTNVLNNLRTTNSNSFITALSKRVRVTDSVCEYKDNSFLVLLTETDLNGSLLFCEKERKLLNEEFKEVYSIQGKVLEVKHFKYGVKEMLDTITRTKPIED